MRAQHGIDASCPPDPRRLRDIRRPTARCARARYKPATSGGDPPRYCLAQPPKSEVTPPTPPPAGQPVSGCQGGPAAPGARIVNSLTRSAASPHPLEQHHNASVTQHSHELSQHLRLSIRRVVMDHRDRPHEIETRVPVWRNHAIDLAELDAGMFAPRNRKHRRRDVHSRVAASIPAQDVYPSSGPTTVVEQRCASQMADTPNPLHRASREGALNSIDASVLLNGIATHCLQGIALAAPRLLVPEVLGNRELTSQMVNHARLHAPTRQAQRRSRPQSARAEPALQPVHAARMPR